LIQDLREYLGYDVDVVTEKGLNSHIREKILQEAVPL
jgi:predicted nucleotidyltransferase